MRFAVAALSIALAACGRPETPDIVLITLDTTRADRLGAMGDATAQTPVLDGLAARGALFERAFASVPLTLPSHATLLTGLDPDQHGIHDNGRYVLADAYSTIAERFAARGYDTAAFVAAFVLDHSFGLARGFGRYDDEVEARREPLHFEVPRRPGRAVTDRALAWLEQRRGGPFFLWVHYYDVHQPRRPPPPFDALPDSYAGALASVDAEVGRLLAGVERAAGARPTLVAVVGDHGEGLGQHDEETHGVLAYDATLHVPLIVAGPQFPAGTRSRTFVRTVDVAPTLLAAAGEPPMPGSRGRPLQGRLATAADDGALGYFECFGPIYRMGWARLGGVRTARWKYTAEPEPVELYDTIADPGETTNRADAEPAVVAELAARWGALRPPPAPTPALAPGIEEQLAALGYVDLPRPSDGASAPDPRRSVAAIDLVDAAREAAVDGRVGDAIRALEALSTLPVARALSLMTLANIQQLAGRPSDAVRAATRLVEITDGLEPRILLGESLLAAGRSDEALRAIDGVTNPPPRARLVRARALIELRRWRDARAALDPILAADPYHDGALALTSLADAGEHGAPTAIATLDARVRDAPAGRDLVQSRAVLADLLRSDHRAPEAVRLLESAPDPPVEHRVVLAEIAAEHGNLQRAATLYASVVAERRATQVYRRRLAELYGRLGRQADALREYDALVDAAPADAALLVDRGVTKAALRRTAEAEADYRGALALDPALPEAHLNLALLELEDGRDGDAEAHLLRAVELRPDYRKAHFHLARLYRRRGDPRAAAQADQATSAPIGNE